jgi:hypothetical protein
MENNNTIPTNILETFPGAEYIESTDIDLDGDRIKLTSKLYIEVGLTEYYLVRVEPVTSFLNKYLAISPSLKIVYKAALEETFGCLN